MSTTPHPFPIPDNVHIAFTQGDCHRLAEALNERGYPLVLIGVITLSPSGEGGMHWVHALNELPDGRFLDITGITLSEDDLFEVWDNELFHQKMRYDTDIDGIARGDDARDILHDSWCVDRYPDIDAEFYADLIHHSLGENFS